MPRVDRPAPLGDLRGQPSQQATGHVDRGPVVQPETEREVVPVQHQLRDPDREQPLGIGSAVGAGSPCPRWRGAEGGREQRGAGPDDLHELGGGRTVLGPEPAGQLLVAPPGQGDGGEEQVVGDVFRRGVARPVQPGGAHLAPLPVRGGGEHGQHPLCRPVQVLDGDRVASRWFGVGHPGSIDGSTDVPGRANRAAPGGVAAAASGHGTGPPGSNGGTPAPGTRGEQP